MIDLKTGRAIWQNDKSLDNAIKNNKEKLEIKFIKPAEPTDYAEGASK